MKNKILFCILSLFLFTACTDSNPNGYINKKEAISLLQNNAVLVDVRTIDEYVEGHIEGAVSIPLNELTKIENLYEKDKTIIVYCQSGNRSHTAYQKLKEMNYEKVYDLGSIQNWED